MAAKRGFPKLGCAARLIAAIALLGLAPATIGEARAAEVKAAAGAAKVEQRKGAGPHTINCPKQTRMIVDLNGPEEGAKFKIEGCFCGTDADFKAEFDDMDEINKTLTAGMQASTASAAVQKAVKQAREDVRSPEFRKMAKKVKMPYEFSVNPAKPGPSTLSKDVKCMPKGDLIRYYGRMVLSPALAANAKFKITK